jgi:Tol biopolymer transport system component
VIAAQAISADGSRIAFCVRKQGRTRLSRIAANGANPVLSAPSLQVRGAPTWSPDGKWIVVSGEDGGRQGLFKVPADGGPVLPLLDGLLSSEVVAGRSAYCLLRAVPGWRA